ncbi:MAG: DUF5107 domain-containing protein [Fimbriimonadales bacterium]|nr:DUF5107 domain-containing protein [Fimbriimonadales bacterium]
MPALRSAQRLEEREFQAVVLANRWVEARICPALGGRLFAFAPRGGSDPLARTGPVRLQPGGARGLRLPAGLWFEVGCRDRLAGLAPVELSAQEDEGSVSLVCFWLAPGEPLAAQVRYTLTDSDAWLRVETRVWNRSMDWAAFSPVWMLGSPLVPGFSTEAALLRGASGSLAVRPTGLPLAWIVREGGLAGVRFEGPAALPPRGVDRHAFRLAPVGFGGHAAAHPSGALLLDEQGIRLQAFAEAGPTELQLLAEDGQTFRAAIQLPDPPLLRIPASSLPPNVRSVAWVARGGAVLAQWPASACEPEPPIPAPHPHPPAEDPLHAGRLWEAEANPILRPAARLMLARQALGREDRETAREHLLDALSWNAEDPLAWWESAAVERLAGNLDNRPQLQNAHYLCPCDPLLRAEAFLSQPAQEGHGPNPLLRPFADDPEAALEAAERLVEAGQWDSAAKFLDAALQWCDHGRLRLLLAWCLASRTRMAPEAARLLADARAWGPPWPWRAAERRAVRDLLGRPGFREILERSLPEACLRELLGPPPT